MRAQFSKFPSCHDINRSAKYLWPSPQKLRKGVSWSTVFFPWTAVVIRFALAEDFESWVASNIKLLCKLSFSRGVDFSQGDGRRALAELLGSLLVFRSKPLAVPTPREGEQRAFCTSH